jgi:hypothetical protein
MNTNILNKIKNIEDDIKILNSNYIVDYKLLKEHVNKNSDIVLNNTEKMDLFVSNMVNDFEIIKYNMDVHKEKMVNVIGDYNTNIILILNIIKKMNKKINKLEKENNKLKNNINILLDSITEYIL